MSTYYAAQFAIALSIVILPGGSQPKKDKINDTSKTNVANDRSMQPMKID